MKIVQSTWVRFWHFDLARELYKLGHLEHIFTCLPWWKARLEAKEQGIPRNKISCNFLLQGIRRVGTKVPGYNSTIDSTLGILETKIFSSWVAKNLKECDTYIGISGTGLKAGVLAKSRESGYIMDRGSTQMRFQNQILEDEYKKFGISRTPIHPWLIENEEAEAEEANLITVPSSFVKNTFIQYGTDPSKIRVIPYGVSLQEFYPTNTPANNVFRIVFVGQFSIRKGAQYLLEAYKNFLHPNKELVIVGSILEDVKPIIKNYSSCKIQFIGTVSRSMVKEYLSTSHILVLPSIEEGFGMVIAQAMACGCAVVASESTGFDDIATHEVHGLKVPSKNAQALTDSFTRLADDQFLLNKMRAAAIERVKELGGWQDYADKMVEAAKEAKILAAKKAVH